MKKYLVIGNPIDHSLSPKLHNYWIKKNKIDAIYEKKLLIKGDLEKTISKLKLGEIDGINVTVPFKNTVISYIDELSEEAKKTQSVNTIYMKYNKIIEGTTPPAPKIRTFFPNTLYLKCLNPNSKPAISVLCPMVLLFLK